MKMVMIMIIMTMVMMSAMSIKIMIMTMIMIIASILRHSNCIGICCCENEGNAPGVTIEDSQKKTLPIIESIIRALQLLHRDKLKPEFIRRYRADEVTSQ